MAGTIEERTRETINEAIQEQDESILVYLTMELNDLVKEGLDALALVRRIKEVKNAYRGKISPQREAELDRFLGGMNVDIDDVNYAIDELHELDIDI